MNEPRIVDRFRAEESLEHLRAFIERQRWFGGRAQVIDGLEIADVVPVRDAPDELSVVLARVTFAGGESDLYHLPLTSRPLADAEVHDIDDPRLVLVSGSAGAGPRVAIYDAMADTESVQQLWAALARGERHRGARGELRFRPLVDISTDEDGVTVRPLAKEQSNSAAVRGDREMLKCLRRVVAGTSPEVEMTAALADAGFDSVPTPLGMAEYTPDGGEPLMLLILQPYFHNGTEGMALALTSLRDFFAEAEERGAAQHDELLTTAREQGATFIPESVRIGEVTGRMHLALASDAIPAHMRGHHVGPAELAEWAALMTAELDRLLDSTEAAIEPLRARRDAIAQSFAALKTLSDGGTAIRVHGDYHLGQLLRIDSGWIVLDFEGEPVRTIDQRRSHSSPLNDVAGMLRSLDYAVALAVADRSSPDSADWAWLLDTGAAWAEANRGALWDAYTATVAGSGLLPPGEAASTLRHAFELRKALYEVGYELGHRPDWVGIPLRHLLGEAVTT
jgi:trehalose synthase-fused probable maltokinase